MKFRRFWKIYMHKILIDRFCEFQKLTQKWKILTFLAILTYYKAFNGNIFIFLIYSRPLWARWCIFQKNPSQFFFDQNHCISPSHVTWVMWYDSFLFYHSLIVKKGIVGGQIIEKVQRVAYLVNQSVMQF